MLSPGADQAPTPLTGAVSDSSVPAEDARRASALSQIGVVCRGLDIDADYVMLLFRSVRNSMRPKLSPRGSSRAQTRSELGARSLPIAWNMPSRGLLAFF